jgi:hypothetical protein
MPGINKNKLKVLAKVWQRANNNLIKKMDLFNALPFIYSFLGKIFFERILLFYWIGLNTLVLEKQNEFHLIAIFHKIVNLDQHMLCNKYLRKFSTKSEIIIILFIIMDFSLKIIIIIIYGVLCFTAYSPHGFNYFYIIYSFWYSLLFITINTVSSIMFMYLFLLYIISMYLKYRFRQIYENLDIIIKRGIHRNNR